MTGCVLYRGLPENLAAATKLRRLEMSSSNRMPYADGLDVVLMPPETIIVLASMPALETFMYQKPGLVPQQHWDRWLLLLQASCTVQGRPPPAVIDEQGVMVQAREMYAFH